MKITFSNLGSIKETTLDLRPLTIIIGPNNSNKTYISYSVYGIWQSINQEVTRSFIGTKLRKESDTVVSLKVDDKFYDSFIDGCKSAVEQFGKQLDTYFQDTSSKLFTKTKFELDISKDEIKESLNQLLKQERKVGRSKINFVLKDDVLFIERTDDTVNDEKEILRYENLARIQLIRGLKSFLFPNPLLFPAERNAFIITYKILAYKRYKLLRQTQRELFISAIEQRQLELTKEQGDIRYPQPIEDFLDFLTQVEFQSIKLDSSRSNAFARLADNIELDIQNNNKTNLKATKFGGKEIRVQVKRGLNIDLYNASSSIKQLAPLLLYLRYRAKENDLLIIDEPEMNLHPESQVKLLEILGMLVNLGVKVVLTTHSPYFMSHLNNLISSDINNQENLDEQAKSLYLKDEHAFLSPEQVSAYEMKNNKLVNLYHKDYGIKYDTLSDVSVDIQQKFFEIYEKGEHTSNGKKEKEG